MQKGLKFIFNILLCALLTAVIIIFVSNWLDRGNERHVPGLGRYKLISVLSDSMKPFISAGDAIIIDSSFEGLLRNGDIITFWREGNLNSLLTHRIETVDTTEGREIFHTRGDANNVADGNPVYRSSIVGKYILHIPRGGYFINFLHSKTGFASLILLPFLLAFGLGLEKHFPGHRLFLFDKENNEPGVKNYKERL